MDAYKHACMALLYARTAKVPGPRAAIENDFRDAIAEMRAALSAAAREGYPPRERAPLFRMLNWLRADLRKMRAA
jgi:hypothetical protein